MASKAYLGIFATNLFIQGCTVLQGVLLARLLGPSGRGDFATVILWPTVFAGFGIFGVNMAITRFSGQGLSADGLVKTAAKASLLTGLVTALVCGIFLPVVLPADKYNLLPIANLFLLFIPINHLALNLQGIDQGVGNFFWLNVTRALSYPIFFSGIAFAWWFAVDKLFWVVVSLLLANGCVALLRLIEKIKSFTSSDVGVKPRCLLKESLPFVTASVIAILYMQMDKALLVWLLMPKEIGWYVAAFAAAGTINVLNSALGVVQLASSAQALPRCGFPLLATVLRRAAILSVFASVILAVALPWLVPLVYGQDFNPATEIAYLLLPGLILAGLGEIVNQALRGQGQPVAGVISKIFGLIVMGLAGFFLAKFWGARGIAGGYIAGELVAFVGLIGVALRYYKDANLSELCPNMTDLTFLSSRLIRFKKI